MKRLFVMCLLFLVSACATRTQYKPHGQSGGYSETKIKDNIYMSRFSGNAYTHADDAKAFAQFRAIEVCRDLDFKVTKIFFIDNKTTSQSVQKSSSYNYQQPTNFIGNSNTSTNYNYYGGDTLNSNSTSTIEGTTYGGSTYGRTTTWNETYNYPIFDVYFSCHNEIYLAGVELKNLSSDDIKEYVKDKLGAIQIIKIREESPNKDIFLIGDIITKVDNVRIFEIPQMPKAVDDSKDKNSITANIIRDGKSKIIKFKAKDFTEMFQRLNLEIINSACNVKEISSRPICSK